MLLPTATARSRYADEICAEAGVTTESILQAFAAVPREHFLGPGPWRLLTREGIKQTSDTDPQQIYANILVELDGEKGINNGLPSLWAGALAAAEISRGDAVLHVGAGSGYYTAIIAELVGESGSVMGVEVVPALAARAKEAVAHYAQIRIISGNGLTVETSPLDVIIASAGLSSIPSHWLDRLKEGGRLLMPLTVVGEWPKPGGGTWRGGRGGMLLIRGLKRQFSARFLCGAGFIPCVGDEDSMFVEELRRAFTEKDMNLVRSLHRRPEPPDVTSWVVGSDWWLSTREVNY